MSTTPPEVLYLPPSTARQRAAAALGALVFAAGVLFLVSKVLQGVLPTLVAAVLVALVIGAQAWARRTALLSPTRVLVDHDAKTLVVEHRRGAVTVALGDITEVEHGTVTLGDGITLDAVTVKRGDADPVRFSTWNAASAEGAARALKAVLSSPP